MPQFKQKRENVVFAQCSSVVGAVSDGQPVWDVPQLVPPDAYVPILRRAVDAFLPNQPMEGTNLFNVLTDTNAPPPALPPALRRASVSEHVPSLFHTASEALRPSPREVVRSMFRRPVCARRLARASVLRGFEYAFRPCGGVGAWYGRFA